MTHVDAKNSYEYYYKMFKAKGRVPLTADQLKMCLAKNLDCDDIDGLGALVNCGFTFQYILNQYTDV